MANQQQGAKKIGISIEINAVLMWYKMRDINGVKMCEMRILIPTEDECILHTIYMSDKRLEVFMADNKIESFAKMQINFPCLVRLNICQLNNLLVLK